MAKRSLVGTGTRQAGADAPGVAPDDSADLQELEADGAGLSAGQFGAGQAQPPHRGQQAISEASQQLLGGVDLGWPQIGDKQLFAAKDVKWQKAVVVIIPTEKTPFLAAMHRHVGGVEVENDLFGRRTE